MKIIVITTEGREKKDIAGDADTVDALHASATPEANKLLAMNANAKFPTHTIEGDLTVESRVTAIGLTLDYAGELTLDVDGEITVATGSYYIIDTFEDAAADDLDTINGGVVGQILIFRSASSLREVTFKDATGNLHLAGDFILDSTFDRIVLHKYIDYWFELSRSNNA